MAVPATAVVTGSVYQVHGGEVGYMPTTSKFPRHVLLAVIVAVGVGSAPGLGQGESKLTASDAEAYDDFGCSVGLSGDTALVGAAYDDDNGASSGSAYIFERIGGVWTEVAKLTASDGAPDDVFGAFVGLCGDMALVGAPYDDDNGRSSGSAYIFERIDGVWVQTAKLTPGEGVAYDWFGGLVALSGDTALVGAPGDDDKGEESGAAYIFAKVGGVWTEVAKLAATDGAAEDYFGSSVSLSGDTALVGAYAHDDNGSDSGSAYVFERDQGGPDNWGQLAKLTASDGAPGDYFGYEVALSGDAALVGAIADDENGGSAYVFEKVAGAWAEVGKLTASDGAAGDGFGGSVALYGDRALIASVGDDDNGSHSGSAYVFEKLDAGWTEVGKLTASDGAADDFFAYSVRLFADTALVGAPYDDDNGDSSGAAYVFALCCGDLDGDWDTDHSDLGILLADWGCDDPVNGCAGDLNGDDKTDHADLGILLADWGCGT
jgi:hypothetical protein